MKILIAPPVLALLPEYAGQLDPVAELRAALTEGLRWLGTARPVVSGDQQARIAAYLLGDTHDPGAESQLVLANGSAMRTDKAPGHFDPRAEAFDAALFAALSTPNPSALTGLDLELGNELWAAGLEHLRELAALSPRRARVFYADDPYGVAYWVIGWELGEVSQ